MEPSEIRTPLAVPSKEQKYLQVYLLVICGIASLLFLSLLLFRGRSKAELATGRDRSPFCSPQLVSEMTVYANRTLDSCKDFFNYACVNRRALHKRRWEQPQETLISQVKQGTSDKPAGIILNTLYKSCIITLITNNDEQVAEQAAGAVLHSSEIQKSITPEVALWAVVIVSLLKLSVLIGMALSSRD